MKLHKYTEEEKEFIKNNAFGITTPELIEKFEERFNIKLKKTQLSSFKKRYGIKSGFTSSNFYFKKGNIPFNKGTKGLTKANITSFKKGNIPANLRPIGSERIDKKDGYILIKVSNEGRRWKFKHKVLWEKYHNKSIPKGYVVTFADQNKENFSKENLILISRRELSIMNREKRFSKIPDITKTNILLTKLNSKVNDLKKRGKKIYEKNKE